MQITPLSYPSGDSPSLPVPKRLEQAFLEEMLKYCGPSPMSGEFSGGYGEDHFASFLTQEYAAILARRLDLGFDRLTMDSAT